MDAAKETDKWERPLSAHEVPALLLEILTLVRELDERVAYLEERANIKHE